MSETHSKRHTTKRSAYHTVHVFKRIPSKHVAHERMAESTQKIETLSVHCFNENDVPNRKLVLKTKNPENASEKWSESGMAEWVGAPHFGTDEHSSKPFDFGDRHTRLSALRLSRFCLCVRLAKRDRRGSSANPGQSATPQFLAFLSL